MIYCKNCGTQLAEDTRFCTACGAKAGETAQAAPGPIPSAAPSAEKNAWQYFCDCWKKYAVFEGRARRAEFWWFEFFSSLFYIAAYVLDLAIFGDIGALTILYCLAILLPSIMVWIRRLRDIDKPGWFLLIPIYGLVICCYTGTPGPNRYGPDPKLII